MENKKELSTEQKEALLNTLKIRFGKNMQRHNDSRWNEVLVKLESNPKKLWSLHEMERTGGEPDVVDYNHPTGEFLFFDCTTESPAGRRSLCYDREGLESRAANKPIGNVLDTAAEMGIELLTEKEYRQLQEFGPCDTKTSSWIATPDAMRKLGGALFGDFRYGNIFIYHNGAQSYYAGRGFRGSLKI